MKHSYIYTSAEGELKYMCPAENTAIAYGYYTLRKALFK